MPAARPGKRPASWWTSSSAPPSCATRPPPGSSRACPAEKSGQEEFDFEYGEGFAQHVEAFDPTFCKVLVRYNPEGDRALNQRQAARLRRLSDYLAAESRSRFMFELLVPAEKAQLDRLKGDKKAYDIAASAPPDGRGDPRASERRRRARCLEGRGPRPARGLPDDRGGGPGRRPQTMSAASFSAAARTTGKCASGSRIAATVPGFIGFAVGRTDFWDPLVAWRSKKATREQAVAAIAGRYREFVDIFEKAHMGASAAAR